MKSVMLCFYPTYLGLLDNSKNLLILGDLNLPDIDWDTYTGSFGTSSAIADLAYNYNMCQLVSDTTHIMGNTLDVILTNSDSFSDVEISSKLPHGMSSDHYMTTFFNKHILSYQTLWPNTYVNRFAKRGLIHAQLQVSLFTIIRQIQQYRLTVHACTIAKSSAVCFY